MSVGDRQRVVDELRGVLLKLTMISQICNGDDCLLAVRVRGLVESTDIAIATGERVINHINSVKESA